MPPHRRKRAKARADAKRPARTPGISYVPADAGETLPVIDITRPEFAVTLSVVELTTLAKQFVKNAKSRQRVPFLFFFQRLVLRYLLRRSELGRGLLAASGTYLSGLHTYRLKLGPESLGPDANGMDRRIITSVMATATRLRLHDVVRLLAEGLAPLLAAQRDRPLLFLNIAGGPAADSWNAAIILQAEHHAALADRHVLIAVLDLDDDGPAFGSRAVTALTAPGGRLAGLGIDFKALKYDWRAADALADVLEQLHAKDAVCAISSEGGLFEYGSDEEIVANLRTLYDGTPLDAIVTGSVTRDDEPAQLAYAIGRPATRPRKLEAFRRLVRKAGWIDDQAIGRPFSYNVRLVKDKRTSS
jgi:hypothetical protein